MKSRKQSVTLRLARSLGSWPATTAKHAARLEPQRTALADGNATQKNRRCCTATTGPRATACPSRPWLGFARARDFVQGVEHMRLLQDAGGSCVQGRCLQSRPMNFTDMLRAATARHGSLLCVGLDPEPARFPVGMQGDARKIYDFCAAVVDATADLVCAFKPQIAYFAAHGAEEQLERLMQHMRSNAPQVPVILDAKRGDIGATAEQYAKEAFERYGADAVTLSPFMGFDSIAPYLAYRGKGAFLLCRTSNPGGDDLQNQRLASVAGQPLLYEHLASLAQGPWNRNGQLGLVVGATYPQEIERVRCLAPTLPLLIPGVGARGGDAAAAVRAGLRSDAPIIVNSSRAILYAGAGAGADFAGAARAQALRMRALLQAARR